MPDSSYAGEDLSVGDTIYQSNIRNSEMSTLSCSDSVTIYYEYTVSQEPLGPAIYLNTSNWGTGPVYPTNVAGVGVAFVKSNQLFSSSDPKQTLLTMNSTRASVGVSLNFNVVLIKTGDIPSGSIVEASSFPTVNYRMVADTGYTGPPLDMFYVNFAGSVQFTTSTCYLPDTTIEMGEYQIGNIFTGPGDTTAWRNFNLQLQGCPVFSGYFGYGHSQTMIDSDTSTGTNVTETQLRISISPHYPLLDESLGGMGLMPSEGTATGLGLQLGYTAGDTNVTLSEPASIWTPGSVWSMTPPNDGSSVILIPLAARYYQVDPFVSPGQATTSLTVTINYL
ncbi:hypothetical protein TW81_12230 [Vibrio galatheae]|uniref:Fimbrial-type adhesion domain-containing protein n=1 Tax=Vibrio galatheae TaxID=579748 RepID=A0A0F4NLP1_9VIBR|nr:type 1 fimbrial protein [Vibrio galatheae]KJY82961.1 hypothetical protein TW81_12230 [Vibrio galatheae]